MVDDINDVGICHVHHLLFDEKDLEVIQIKVVASVGRVFVEDVAQDRTFGQLVVEVVKLLLTQLVSILSRHHLLGGGKKRGVLEKAMIIETEHRKTITLEGNATIEGEKEK